MPNKLVLGGFDELRNELVALPEASKRDATPILARYARAAQAQVVQAYPVITGQLRAGVSVVERVARGVAAFFALVSSAPYAHIYEFGSFRQRPRATFLPISEAARRESVKAVARMVEEKGLVVRGAND